MPLAMAGTPSQDSKAGPAATCGRAGCAPGGCQQSRPELPLSRAQKLSNTALAALRAPVEHGIAHLKNRRVVSKIRTDPNWVTALVQALLVLTNREVSR
ncbi:hypothetical protein [Streptomyces melanogenes]|uniref:hypothetical protein n=1 Tax=Streptomyces melanogenes TaxID=67326 RepID=UPI0037AAB863